MGKFVVGDVVVLPFPHTDLSVGKRRPALVLAISSHDDVILCQITSQSHAGPTVVPISKPNFQRGQLALDCFARVNRLFTVDSAVILYTVGALNKSTINNALRSARSQFRDVH